MTVTVLLQLIDEGKLSLDDKLSKFYPDYPQSEKITIAMLMDMKSGIFNYSEDMEVFQHAGSFAISIAVASIHGYFVWK